MTILIDAAQLTRLKPALPAGRAATYATVLDAALAGADITTPLRIAHFIAQVMHETGGMRGLIEGFVYKDPARLVQIFRNVQNLDHAKRLIAAGPIATANAVYANKNGNGGIASGDGYRYRGRGFLQVTGRGNYRAVGTLIDMSLEEEPDLLGRPDEAAIAAATYWKMCNINVAADADDVGSVTSLVNGPKRQGLADRKDWLTKTKKIWR